jgi:predicted TIM-barrel fold metal-dependent hydrolase
MAKAMFSADSHVMEPPNCYVDYIDPKFRERAPHMVQGEERGDYFVIEGIDRPFDINLICAAGKDPEAMRISGGRFEDVYPGSWDPKARMADQDRDGVGAEIIYASIGMLICNLEDADYKHASMWAYNRWLQEFCAGEPERLFGLGMAAMRTPEEGAAEIRMIKEMGFAGVMMPGQPCAGDYDAPAFDQVWEAAADLEMPLAFHILTNKGDTLSGRRPKIAAFLTIMRGVQDVISMLVYSGVFARHPKLKVIAAEADAGWLPHFAYRMDHAYKRHRHWMKAPEMDRLPSEYLYENVWLTFQDDWTAIKLRHEMNPDRLLWANDFPHSDATWPNSQQLLAEKRGDMGDGEFQRLTRDNCAELYGIALP